MLKIWLNQILYILILIDLKKFQEVDNLKEIVKSTMDAYPNFCRSEGKKVLQKYFDSFD